MERWSHHRVGTATAATPLPSIRSIIPSTQSLASTSISLQAVPPITPVTQYQPSLPHPLTPLYDPPSPPFPPTLQPALSTGMYSLCAAGDSCFFSGDGAGTMREMMLCCYAVVLFLNWNYCVTPFDLCDSVLYHTVNVPHHLASACTLSTTHCRYSPFNMSSQHPLPLPHCQRPTLTCIRMHSFNNPLSIVPLSTCPLSIPSLYHTVNVPH